MWEVTSRALEAAPAGGGDDEFGATVVLPFGGAPGSVLVVLSLGGLVIVVFPRVVLHRVRLGVLMDDGHELAHAHAVLLGALELSAEVGEVGVVREVRVHRVDAKVLRRVDEVGDAVLPFASRLAFPLDVPLEVFHSGGSLAGAFKVLDEGLFQLGPGADAVLGKVVYLGVRGPL